MQTPGHHHRYPSSTSQRTPHASLFKRYDAPRTIKTENNFDIEQFDQGLCDLVPPLLEPSQIQQRFQALEKYKVMLFHEICAKFYF